MQIWMETREGKHVQQEEAPTFVDCGSNVLIGGSFRVITFLKTIPFGTQWSFGSFISRLHRAEASFQGESGGQIWSQ